MAPRKEAISKRRKKPVAKRTTSIRGRRREVRLEEARREAVRRERERIASKRAPPSPPRIIRRRTPARRTTTTTTTTTTTGVRSTTLPSGRRRRIIEDEDEEEEEEEEEEGALQLPSAEDVEEVTEETEGVTRQRNLCFYQLDGELVQGPFLGTFNSSRALNNDIKFGDIQSVGNLEFIAHSYVNHEHHTIFKVTNLPIAHFNRSGISTRTYQLVTVERDIDPLFNDEEMELARVRIHDNNTREERRIWFTPCTNIYLGRLYRNISDDDVAHELVGYHQTAVYRPFGVSDTALRRVTYGWAGPDVRPESLDPMANKLDEIYRNFVESQRHTRDEDDENLFQVVFRFIPNRLVGATEGPRSTVFRTYTHRSRNDVIPSFHEVLELVDSGDRETIRGAIEESDYSDPDYNPNEYTLDTTMFIIQMYTKNMPYRLLKEQRELDMLQDPETSLSTTTTTTTTTSTYGLGSIILGGGTPQSHKRGYTKFIECFTYHTNKKNDCLVQNVLKYLRERDLTQLTWQHIKNYRTNVLGLEANDFCFLTSDHILKIELMFGININVFNGDKVELERDLGTDEASKPIFKVKSCVPSYYYKSDRTFRYTLHLVLHKNHYYIADGYKTVGFSPIACLPFVEGNKVPKLVDEMNFLLSSSKEDPRCDQIIKAHDFMRSRRIQAQIRLHEEGQNQSQENQTHVIYGEPIELPEVVSKYKNFRSCLRKYMRDNNINTKTDLDDFIPPRKVLEETRVRSIIFDFETVFDANDNNQARPYSLSWVEIQHDFNTGVPIFDYDNPPGEVPWLQQCHFDIGDNCCESLIKELTDFEKLPVVLVGFNSSRFDNIILLDQLLRRDLIPEVFWAQGSIMSMRWNGNTSFDVSNFIRGVKLMVACNNFKTNPKKVEGFDHTTPQDHYNKGGMDELMRWCHENYIKLHEYNCIDVLCLADLYRKLCLTCIEVCGRNRRIYDHLTVGSLAYDVWESMSSAKLLDETADKDDICRIKPIPFECDQLMRKAITGGRCQLFTDRGETLVEEGRYYMVDVKSLYPTVMKFEYPNGEISPTFSEVPEKFGVYRCQIISQPRVRIVPKKSKNIQDPLDWHILDNKPFERWLTTIDIQYIRKYGGEVVVHEGFIYDSKGYVFKEYVAKFERLKNQEDIFNRTHNPEYNPSKREFYKILLNSLSGKTLQRTFQHVSKLCLTESKLRNFCSKLQGNTIQLGMYSKAVLASGDLKEPPKLARKPCILGMYIYSYGRNYMYDHVIYDRDILYMDTDSGLFRELGYNRLRQEKSYLFPELEHRDPRFGDLEEEVCDRDGNPATNIVLLRPKAYMVYNQNTPQKSKMKLKGVSKRDRFISNKDQLLIISKLIATKDYVNLDKIYESGTIDIEHYSNETDIDMLTEERRTLGLSNSFASFQQMGNEFDGWFLCSMFQRVREFAMVHPIHPVSFAVKRELRLKHLRFNSSEGLIITDFTEKDTEMANILTNLY